MKKRVSFLMIFLLALLLTGCSEKSGGSTQYQVYYISTSGTKLVEESYMWNSPACSSLPPARSWWKRATCRRVPPRRER